MIERIRRMLIKEFIQLRRNPRMRAIVIAIPIVQTLIFGYAVTTEVRSAKTAIYDADHTVASRNLIAAFTGGGHFRIVAWPQNDREVQDLVDHSRVLTVIHIPQGFERRLQGGEVVPVQMILDGTDSNSARIVMSYASRIVLDYNTTLRRDALRVAGLPPPNLPVRLQTRAWFNENLDSRYYYVPGVTALLVGLVTLLLSSMAVVREKEIGTIEQIIVTPIRQFEFILGKMIPFILIAFVDVLLVTAIAIFWFEVPLRGSLTLLLGATALYLMSTLGVGLLISTVSSTQQQAMMTTFFFFLPAVLLSGFIFPIASMPVPVQWLTFLNPLRYYLVIVRGIFLKGVGASLLWPQMLGLVALGTIALAIASLSFRKTLA